MRVLLEQECTAVSGGHETDCEKALKSFMILSGGLAGGVAGGGVFSVPGAIVGAGAGALAADAFGHIICSALEAAEEESDGGEIDPEVAAAFLQELYAWSQGGAFPNSYGYNPTGPHELVVNTSGQ